MASSSCGRSISTAAGAPLTGACFAHGRVVVASGRYLLRVAPRSGRFVDWLETFPHRGGLAYDGHCLWQPSEDGLQQLDLRTGFVRQRVSLDLDELAGLECLGRDLLVLHDGGRRLARIRVRDETSVRMRDDVPIFRLRRRPPPANSRALVLGDADLGEALRGLTWANGSLWSSAGAALVRVGPFTGHISERVPLPAGVAGCDVAFERGVGLWCVDDGAAKLRAFAWSGAQGGWPSRPPDAVPSVDTPPPEAAPATAPAPTTPVDGPPATFERVLVPVDFSSGSRRALAAAMLLKDHLHSEVHLLHLGTLGSNAEFLAASGARVGYGDIEEDAKAEALRFLDHVVPGRASEIVVHAVVGEDLARAFEAIAAQVRPTLVILADAEPHTRQQAHWRKRIERMAVQLDGVALMVVA